MELVAAVTAQRELAVSLFDQLRRGGKLPTLAQERVLHSPFATHIRYRLDWS